MTVTRKPDRRGEHEISRKTIACGNAGRFRCTRCYSCAFYHYQVHTRPRVQRAPGIPRALPGADTTGTTRALRAAGLPTHLSTSLRGALATKQSILLCGPMDCFRLRSSSYGGQVASLAMTGGCLKSNPTTNTHVGPALCRGPCPRDVEVA